MKGGKNGDGLVGSHAAEETAGSRALSVSQEHLTALGCWEWAGEQFGDISEMNGYAVLEEECFLWSVH